MMIADAMMTATIRHRFLAAAGAAIAGLTWGAPALAVTVPGTIILAPATVQITPALSFAVITVPGTYYNASTDSALLGADPSVSTDFGPFHGASEARLDYQIELIAPPNPLYPDPSVNDPAVSVGIVMSDVVYAADDDFGPKADASISISAGAGNSGLVMENCAGNVFTGCAAGLKGFTTTPFAAVTMVDLVPNVVYDVVLRADEESGGHGEVDPTFTAPAGDYFVYSAGIGAVPEPGTWAMMVLGMGALGFALRRRAQQLVLAPAFC